LKKGAVVSVNGVFKLQLDDNDFKRVFVVSYIGYDRKEIKLDRSRTKLIIELSQSEISLSEVVVTESRLASEEFKIEKIDQLEIYKSPVAKADPILAVNGLGYATTTDESANISLRGSSPEEGAIFLNNVPIYDAVKFAQLDGLGTFSIFNNAVIDNVEVYPSNPPIEYGGATSGIISLKTKTEKLPVNELHSVTASLVSLGYNINKNFKGQSLVNAFVNSQHSYLLKAINPEALNQLPFFANLDMGIFYTHQFGDFSRLNIYNYSLIEGYEFIQSHPSTELRFEQQRLRNFTIANLIYKKNNPELSLNIGYNRSRNDFVGGNLDLVTTNTDVFFSMNMNVPLKESILKFGSSFDRRFQNLSGIVPEFSFARDVIHPTIDLDFSEVIENLETYGYFKRFLTEDLVAAVGFRKNIPINNQPDYLSFQTNWSFKVNEWLEFIFSYGTYNKYEFDGFDSELRGRINSRQLALDTKFKIKNASIITGVYKKRSKDTQHENNIFGLDATYQQKIGKKLTSQFSFTTVNSTLNDTQGNEFPSQYDLGFFFRSNLTYESNSWSISFVSNHRSGVSYAPVVNSTFLPSLNVYEPEFVDVDQPGTLPEYHIINLSISKTFFLSEQSNLIGFININNVTDRKNVEDITYNFDYSEQRNLLLSRRLFFVGFNLNFF